MVCFMEDRRQKMSTISTLGPHGSDACQAAHQYDADADLIVFNHLNDVLACVETGQSDYALIPVYNTREGEIKDYFRVMGELRQNFWVDNVVLPIHLSMGGTDRNLNFGRIGYIYGRASVLNQCENYISRNMPQATRVSVYDIALAVEKIRGDTEASSVLIDTEDVITSNNLVLVDRELAAHNRTRFAIIGPTCRNQSGYDATSIITRPLADRVGLLVDTLNEFTRRGINIVDLRSRNDIETQKLQIYLEIEGHREDPLLAEALRDIERRVIQEPNCLKILGSFPRVDMRVKHIRSFGFIGSGDMSRWFSDQLQSEGYDTVITGRSTKLRPEQMIPRVDVVIVCVPISATTETVKKYGPLLEDGQALVILAGESEKPLSAALEVTSELVEVMLVHNLWGPQVVTMKDKNVAVVKTRRSGSFCNEFESFLYKYGAEIYQDSAEKHDLMMGVSQKLPTTISVALAMTLAEHGIDYDDIDSHSTLTSLYGVLAMARTHSQNPRTYAEIMATSGEGQKIVASFIAHLIKISDLAEQRSIEDLADIVARNRQAMPVDFVKSKMSQAQAVDAVLSDIGFKGE